MAVLAAGQVSQLWSDGQAEHLALFTVKKVSTGDTIDLSAQFRVLLQVVFMGATVAGIATATFAGTTVTAPTGLTTAGAYMLVQGVAI
jgi:hypothetical protein